MRRGRYSWPRGDYKNDAHQEKNTNSSKYHLRGREYLFHIYQISDKNLRLGAYQANTLSKRVTEGIEDVYSRIKPLGPSIIAISGLIYPLYLLLKDVENGGGRVAGLELGGEWMGK